MPMVARMRGDTVMILPALVWRHLDIWRKRMGIEPTTRG